MKTLNYFLCILAVFSLAGCSKQGIADSSIKRNAAKNSTSTLSSSSYPSYNTSPLPPDQTGMTSTAVQIASNITMGLI